MKLPEFAVSVLKQYALEQGINPRSTSDLSPMESWLIRRLYQHREEEGSTAVPVGLINRVIVELEVSQDDWHSTGTQKLIDDLKACVRP